MAASRVCRWAAAFLACAACWAFVPLSACLSRGAADIQGFDKAPLYGMVYDDRNEPCQGALISVDGSAGPRTDLSGRFVVQELARGAHTVAVEKPGFERLETTVDFFDKSQVLYLKVISLDQLLVRLEDALAQRRLGDAAGLLARAEAVSSAHADVRYLEAVYLLKSGEASRAAEALERLLAEGERSPALYLTLADIYQYALIDMNKAKAALAAYLKVQEDSQARSRLEALP